MSTEKDTIDCSDPTALQQELMGLERMHLELRFTIVQNASIAANQVFERIQEIKARLNGSSNLVAE